MALSSTQREEFERQGFLQIPIIDGSAHVERLKSAFTVGRPQRNALSTPEVRDFVTSTAVLDLIGGLFVQKPFAIRAILFEKSDAANWKVAWHQDLTIAVRARHELTGFGPWSVKSGVIHVQPPAEIMAQIIALRFHLDDNTPDNGALRIIPGSHRNGRLTSEAADLWKSHTPIECLCKAGDALLMKPLVLHASSAANLPIHRRVLHVEFADFDLPAPLHWHERLACGL